MKLDTPLLALPGVGPARLEMFQKLGLETVQDLLLFRPRRYIDLTHPRQIKDARPGDVVVISGTVQKISTIRSPKRRMWITEAMVADDSSQISAIWFNQPYLGRQYKTGTGLMLRGRVTVAGAHRQLQPTTTMTIQQAADSLVLPVYATTRGLSSRQLSAVISKTLPLASQIVDPLPEAIRNKYGLTPLGEAIKIAHRPPSAALAARASRRFAFDELFMFALQSQLARRAWQSQPATSLPANPAWLDDLRRAVGFTLTGDQERAITDILADLRQPRPMHRLLNGDVGSGKTVVAAAGCLVAAKCGQQAAIMAPTLLLAEQHSRTLRGWLTPLGLKVALVTGLRKEKTDDADVIVGTHALLSDKVEMPRLSFVVVDEQHRFGVKQRQALRAKGGEKMPHLLSLSATPIPRTVALLFAGELDLSKLEEKPVGRKEVKTRLVKPPERASAYDFAKKHLSAHHQAFAVVPLIEETGEEETAALFALAERASLEKALRELTIEFAGFRVAPLHGRMKPKEKQETMARFAAGEIDLLVSTSVVEVGIDVPNATIMMINDADRFGLAQLHQFRGRVGRGEQQSFCFLFTETLDDNSFKRLRQFETETDGFKLAEMDLQTRGPGELFGLLQHGQVDEALFGAENEDLMEMARGAAEELVKTDPELQGAPALLNELKRRQESAHLE